MDGLFKMQVSIKPPTSYLPEVARVVVVQVAAAVPDLARVPGLARVPDLGQVPGLVQATDLVQDLDPVQARGRDRDLAPVTVREMVPVTVARVRVTARVMVPEHAVDPNRNFTKLVI
jgi:hypothetical protein